MLLRWTLFCCNSHQLLPLAVCRHKSRPRLPKNSDHRQAAWPHSQEAHNQGRAMDTSKDDDVMKQAQHIWSMLDELADSDPEAYKKFIEKNIAEGRERQAPAKPSMCIKTRTLGVNQSDLFINICSWSQVPRPKTDHEPIPVIGGDIKELKEDSKTFKVVPIAFNPEVLKECFEREDTTSMLLNLSIDFITDLFKINVDRNFTKLKDSKFKGDPVTLISSFQKSSSKKSGVTELMQDDEDSLIGRLGKILKKEDKQLGETEGIILSTNSPKKPIQNGGKLIEEISSTEISLPTPEYLLKLVNKDDIDDVCLLVEDLYKLQLVLPEAVIEDNTTAKFNKKSTTLNIKIPTKSQASL
ncbi:PIH1 domain-containing protein 2-like [Anneissia japonica]|uniref:PIH1 domain-containing protein 2-like n=1 Tax=Anneissia japonica TaxID=1529436 RepID=UPI001425889D|nr:PIH1 domain-containing protein 2-like [Anneissia japonica]